MEGLKFRGRPPILIAGSVKGVVSLKNWYARMIMDREMNLGDSFANAIIAQSLMSWEGRHPKPALDEDGNFQRTDLDLFSFLTPLAARGAVIEISRYHNRRQTVKRPNERRIGTPNRFGPITGLISHQDLLSFSVRIFDNSIIKQDLGTGRESIGDYRDFMLIDCDGYFYDDWDRIYFNPSAEENRFLTECGLLTGNTVHFQHYIHPNRWQSVFSSQYLLKKMLIDRINDEADFYKGEVQRLQGLGFRFPPSKKYYVPLSSPSYRGDTIPIRVSTIEMVLDIPKFSGTYSPVPESQIGLLAAYRRQKYLIYTLRPRVQFQVRANEAAYFLYGGAKEGYPGTVAYWMEGRSWKPDQKVPGGRIKWNQMVLSSEMALRYRVKDVTTRVSAE